MIFRVSSKKPIVYIYIYTAIVMFFFFWKWYSLFLNLRKILSQWFAFILFHPNLPSTSGRTLEPKAYFSRYSMAKMGLIDQWSLACIGSLTIGAPRKCDNICIFTGIIGGQLANPYQIQYSPCTFFLAAVATFWIPGRFRGLTTHSSERLLATWLATGATPPWKKTSPLFQQKTISTSCWPIEDRAICGVFPGYMFVPMSHVCV